MAPESQYMTPSLPLDDLIDHGVANTVFTRQVYEARSSHDVARLHFEDVNLLEHRAAVRAAHQSISATFVPAVFYIVPIRTFKQMGRITAGRVIAPMQNQADRFTPIRQVKGDTMRPSRILARRSRPALLSQEEPVTVLISSPGPQPAFAFGQLAHTTPEQCDLVRRHGTCWSRAWSGHTPLYTTIALHTHTRKEG